MAVSGLTGTTVRGTSLSVGAAVKVIGEAEQREALQEHRFRFEA